MRYFLYLLFAVLASCAHAQDDKPALLSVSFAPFPLPLLRTYASPDVESPMAGAKPRFGWSENIPPAVQIDFEDKRGYKARKGSYVFLSRNTLRVYLTRNFGRLATSGSATADLATLQRLLRARPSSVPSSSKTGSLPEYPCRHAAQAFELHIHYVDAPWGSGVGYMTLFTQDGSNHADNDELQYLFQGVSKDGSLYISADFHLTHPRLDQWNGQDAEKGDYRADCKLLSSLKGNSFTPSLPAIYEWLQSLKFY